MIITKCRLLIYLKLTIVWGRVGLGLYLFQTGIRIRIVDCYFFWFFFSLRIRIRIVIKFWKLDPYPDCDFFKTWIGSGSVSGLRFFWKLDPDLYPDCDFKNHNPHTWIFRYSLFRFFLAFIIDFCTVYRIVTLQSKSGSGSSFQKNRNPDPAFRKIGIRVQFQRF